MSAPFSRGSRPLRFVAFAIFVAALTVALPTDAQNVCARIAEITPNVGGAEGGTLVTIHGGSFYTQPCCMQTCGGQVGTVTFGGLSAEIVEYTEYWIKVRTPPHPPGFVTVAVHKLGGTLADRNDGFQYISHGNAAIPTVSSFGLLLLAVLLAAAGAVALRASA